jgi:hypothetical protein
LLVPVTVHLIFHVRVRAQDLLYISTWFKCHGRRHEYTLSSLPNRLLFMLQIRKKKKWISWCYFSLPCLQSRPPYRRTEHTRTGMAVSKWNQKVRSRDFLRFI